MTSGRIVVQLVSGENAVWRYRALMGKTDPAKASPGTIRRDFGQSIQENAVHGSDSEQTAQTEIAFFFEDGEIDG